jgi:tetratricopeptide (TPR) repeat protein
VKRRLAYPCGVLVAAGLCCAPPAAAERARPLGPDVMQAAEQGRQLFDEGRYEEAIEMLSSAYESSGEAAFLQYIGRCHQELGQWCEAAEHYQRFLDDAEPAEEVRLRLQAAQEEAARNCRPPPPPPPPPPSPPPPPPPVPREPAELQMSSAQLVGWLLVGTGLASVVAASVLWGLAWHQAGVAEDQSQQADQEEPGSFAELTLRAEASSAEDQKRAFALTGDVLGFAVGLGAAAAGLAVLLVARARRGRGAEGNGGAGLRLGPGPGTGWSLSWHW